MSFPIAEPVEQADRPRGALRVRPRSSGNYTQQCNVTYAETHGVGLVMDVFQPTSAPNGLGIVDVVSGAWHSERARLNEHIGLGAIDALCGAGFTVFAAAPGSASLFSAARMVTHVHCAIRYIKCHAASWPIDPAHLGLCGVSAGGHLAALAALAPQAADPSARLPWYLHDTNVTAAALFFPPTDLLDYGGRPFNVERDSELPIARMLFEDGLAAHSPDEIEVAARAISPLHQIRAAHPPFLLTHATADAIVPYGQSKRFSEALAQAGTDVTLLTHEGDGHPWRGISHECGQIAAWFTEKLGSNPLPEA